MVRVPLLSKWGRPSKYNPDLFPKQAYIACLELGAFDKELAKLFGVTPETIRQWKKGNDEFSLAIKRGVIEYGNQIAVLNLRKRVEGFHYPEVKTEEIIFFQGKGERKISVPAIKLFIFMERFLFYSIKFAYLFQEHFFLLRMDVIPLFYGIRNILG